jgi:hypothetical protein
MKLADACITVASLGNLLLLECSTLVPVDLTLPTHGGYALGLHAQKQGRKALARLSAQLKQAERIIDVQTQFRPLAE